MKPFSNLSPDNKRYQVQNFENQIEQQLKNLWKINAQGGILGIESPRLLQNFDHATSLRQLEDKLGYQGEYGLNSEQIAQRLEEEIELKTGLIQVNEDSQNYEDSEFVVLGLLKVTIITGVCIFIVLYCIDIEFITTLITGIAFFFSFCIFSCTKSRKTIYSRKDYGLNQIIPAKSTVVRNKQQIMIETSHIVQGDIMILSENKKVGADCRAIWIDKAENFTVHHSLLSEVIKPRSQCTEPINQIQSRNFIPQGSTVTSGYAKAVALFSSTSSRLWKLAQIFKSEEIKRINNTAHLSFLFQIYLYGSMCAIISIILAIVFPILEKFVRNRTDFECFFIAGTTLVAFFPGGILITCQLAQKYFFLKEQNGYKLSSNPQVQQMLAISAQGNNTYNSIFLLGDLSYLQDPKQTNLISLWVNMKEINLEDSGKFLDFKKSKVRDNSLPLKSLFSCFQATMSEKNKVDDQLLGKYFNKMRKIDQLIPSYDLSAKTINGNCQNVTEDINLDFTIRVVYEKNNKGDFVVYVRGDPNLIWNACEYIEREGETYPITQHTQNMFLEMMTRTQSRGERVSAFAKLDLTTFSNIFDNQGNLLIKLQGFSLIAFASFNNKSKHNARSALQKLSQIQAELILFTKYEAEAVKQFATSIGLLQIGVSETNKLQNDNSKIRNMGFSSGINSLDNSKLMMLRQLNNQRRTPLKKEIQEYENSIRDIDSQGRSPFSNDLQIEEENEEIFSNPFYQSAQDCLIFETEEKSRVVIVAKADILKRQKVVKQLQSNKQRTWYIAGSILEQKAFAESDVIFSAPYEIIENDKQFQSIFQRAGENEQLSQNEYFQQEQQMIDLKSSDIALNHIAHSQLNLDAITHPTYIHAAINAIINVSILPAGLRRIIFYISATHTASFMPLILYIAFGLPLAISPLLMILLSGPVCFFPALSLIKQHQIDETLSLKSQKFPIKKAVTTKLVIYSLFIIGIMSSGSGILAFFTTMNYYGFSPSTLFGLANIEAYPSFNNLHLPPYPIHKNIAITPDMPFYNPTFMKQLDNCNQDAISISKIQLNWFTLNKYNHDLRSSLVYCDLQDNKWKTSVTWSTCNINQNISTITKSTICYSPEALYYSQTAYFLGIFIFQLLHAFSSKSLIFSIFKTPFSCLILLGIIAQLVVVLLIVQIPIIQQYLGTRSVSFWQWAIPAIPLALFSSFHEEIRKILSQRICFIQKFSPN